MINLNQTIGSNLIQNLVHVLLSRHLPNTMAQSTNRFLTESNMLNLDPNGLAV
jgi:hypothetical protein